MKRRDLLKGGALAAAASAFPAPAIAQGRVRWKMVLCWPRNFPALGTGSQRI